MKPITLFVVDDYLLERISLRNYFEKDKYFKLLKDFSNANECILELEKQKPDIILFDIELQGINGIEAIKIIKEKYPKIKTAILTSYKDEKRIIASFSCGAVGYILKNKSEKTIKKAIKTIMSGRIWLDVDLARNAFNILPKPNIKDLNNLYDDFEFKKDLTEREMEVLKLITEGKTNSEIADSMFVSTNTAKAHVGNILNKLSVEDRVQAAVVATKANLFSNPKWGKQDVF